MLRPKTRVWFPRIHQLFNFCRIPITGYSGIPPSNSRAGETMARDRKDLGARKFVRVDLRQKGFLIPAPDAPWIECYILDISENGACLDVGALAVPKLFGLSLTAGGEVRRVCTLIWRKGELVGVRFISAQELRKGAAPAAEPDAVPKKARALN